MKKRTLTYLLLAAVITLATVSVGWGKKERTTEDFMKIAATGAGLVLDASGRDANDLLKIAAVCGSRDRTLYLKNCGGFETIDLMRIAAAGSGHVVLEF